MIRTLNRRCNLKLALTACCCLTASMLLLPANNHNPLFDVSSVHIDGSDYVIIPPDANATAVRTGVTMQYRNGNAPTQGSTELSWQSGNKIDVYEAGAATDLNMPQTWIGGDQSDKDLELEARPAAIAGNKQTLEAVYTDASGKTSPAVKKEFTLLRAS